LTFKATGVTDISVAATQEAKPEFVTVENVSAPKGGGNVTVTGASNSKKMTFTLGTGALTITLPDTYTAGGASTTNGANITGDPGATAQYNFSLVVNVPANATTSSLARAIVATTDGGQQASGTITQAAGDPTLSVTPTSITLTAAGTAVSVAVTSNTNWTVE
jgi:hypothetical protein